VSIVTLPGQRIANIEDPKQRRVLRMLAAGLLCLSGVAHAQDDASANDIAQSNNPLANATAFNVHNYYIGKLTETDESGNQFWLRMAKPFSIGETNWLMRASLPVNTYPVPPGLERTTALGDLNAFAAYLIDVGNPAISFGVGPLISVPTATEDATGAGKWSAGLVNVLFSAASPRFQYGYLLTWQASFAGDEDRADVNVAAFQPLLIYQLGGGIYLRSTPIMTYDFKNDTYTVPFGLGIGQVWKDGKTVYNLFVEPQWSVADKGGGWPAWQVFAGFNMVFKD
jgi:hypothetical protein